MALHLLVADTICRCDRRDVERRTDVAAASPMAIAANT